MELLIGIILVIGIIYFATRKPVYNLPKFEKTYDAAVSRFGEKDAEKVIVGVQLACEALDAKFTAAQEAEAQIASNNNSANADEANADETVETAEEDAKELERLAREAREKAAAEAKTLKANASRKRDRVKKLGTMRKHMS